MNRRGMRIREFYGCALIAGIGHDEAEDMLIGYIMDMYMIRLKYDAKLAALKAGSSLLG